MPNLLIADGELAICHLLAAAQPAGTSIFSAGEASQAITILASRTISLVVLAFRITA